MAALTGVDDFPFTYSKSGKNSSILTFSVGGTDKYTMTWTGAKKGTFDQSFNDTAGNKGSFTIALD
jgi:hypothetical protein